MADGKNKRLTKGGKKGEKKIVEDKKKEDTVKAPDMFIVPDLGETRTQETRIDSDLVFEVNLADLNLNDKVAFRKFKLITEDVQGENCLTNFHGMDLTRNQMCSIVKCSIVKCSIKDKKRQTPFETRVAVKTTDGYLVRLFCDGFLASPRYLGTTKIVKPQQAQHRQIRQIRQMHKKIRTPEVQTDDLEVVQVIKLVPYSVGKDMEEAFQKGYPDVCVRKVQMLKEPEFELGKPMELHGGGSAVKATGDETGVKVERADGYEPPIHYFS